MPRHVLFLMTMLSLAAGPYSRSAVGDDDQPQARSLPAETITAIDGLIADAIAAGDLPGAVVLIGTSQGPLLRKAYGDRQVLPEREPMTVDTVFDLASLTKPLATATSVLILADEGRIDIEAPVAKYLPEFGTDGKERITVTDLLVHRGGLIADNHLRDYGDGPDKAWERICDLKPTAEPGEKFIYSDVGFLVLGRLVERVSGESLDQFTRDRIWRPLGMSRTGYLPDTATVPLIAPTEQQGTEWIRGRVHDPRASALGGVAGHAGLFANVDDLSRYARMVLAGGALDDHRVLSQAMVQRMTAATEVPRGTRGLGWDKQSPYSSNKGEALSDAAIGHGGFTGTVLWIDPAQDLYFVFLSSRLHPDGKGSVNGLAGKIITQAAESMRTPQQ
ncbi:MAG: serine hydrolase domain-containing protein [Planctomycetaceae bacterium]